MPPPSGQEYIIKCVWWWVLFLLPCLFIMCPWSEEIFNFWKVPLTGCFVFGYCSSSSLWTYTLHLDSESNWFVSMGWSQDCSWILINKYPHNSTIWWKKLISLLSWLDNSAENELDTHIYYDMCMIIYYNMIYLYFWTHYSILVI